MKYLRSIRDRIRRLRRIRAARADATPLREFIYLDEVSVYSLLASRQGALPTEYTHIQTRSVTDGLASSLGATAGVAKTSISSKSESTQSESTQILRKSSVQAAFRDLYAGEEDKLVLSPMKAEQEPPRVTDWAAVEADAGTPSFHGWIIDPETFARGAIPEVEVELQASQINRYSSIFAALEDLAEEGRSLFPASLYAQLRDLKGASSILRRMLIGLIPIKCRAVDYKAISIKGKRLIIHKRILAQLPAGQLPQYEELYVTGVTEEMLFWKDVRRVLFSGSRYRILGRLNHSDIHSSWVPVKLVDVLSDVDPSFARQIGQLDLSMDMHAQISPVIDDRQQRLLAALLDFGISLAKQYGHTLTPDELLAAMPEPQSELVYQSAVEPRRILFQHIADIVSKHLQAPPDAEIVAQLREAAIARAGLNLDGTVKSNTKPISPSASAVTGDTGAIIDCEVIAIYW